jgi:hypothetical protein
MSSSKREGVLRLSLFIILVPLMFIVKSNPAYLTFVAFVVLYALVTGILRLTYKE